MNTFDGIKKFFCKKNKKRTENDLYFKNSTTKRSMNAACTLKFSTDTEKIKSEIEEELKAIVKKYFDYPEKLINYIRLEYGNVYKIRNAEKILSVIGESEGFITPLKGLKALYLNFIVGFYCEGKIKLDLTTKGMFVFSYNNSEIYTIARALHKYMGFKKHLPGYDYKSQEIFKKMYNNQKNRSLILKQCSIKEMYACKDAIARDLESINFTIQLSDDYAKAKKTLKKIKENKNTNV